MNLSLARNCLVVLSFACVVGLSGCKVTYYNDGSSVVIYDSEETVLPVTKPEVHSESVTALNKELEIPAYSGKPYAEINGNKPFFNEYPTDAFENYSDLDKLGRCGVAYANVCKDIMPTEQRGQIGSVKPSGWHTIKYNGVINGNYLYNRCHLIAYQLAGENANPKNLITGTRYLNIDGMVPFENKVADHIKKNGGHVLYRVTPIFTGDNLVADGVLMEGYSVEDKGAGVQFCAFCYNVQPGITIDYAITRMSFISVSPLYVSLPEVCGPVRCAGDRPGFR